MPDRESICGMWPAHRSATYNGTLAIYLLPSHVYLRVLLHGRTNSRAAEQILLKLRVRKNYAKICRYPPNVVKSNVLHNHLRMALHVSLKKMQISPCARNKGAWGSRVLAPLILNSVLGTGSG